MRRRPQRVDEPAARQQGPQFARFTAAMDEARARGAQQFALYSDPSGEFDGLAGAGRSRRRTALRWVGIGGCVLVVCGLVSWLVWPQTAQLVSRWLATEWSGGAAPIESVLLRPALAFEPAYLATHDLLEGALRASASTGAAAVGEPYRRVGHGPLSPSGRVSKRTA